MSQCEIEEVDVCDKADINLFNPYEDVTYYETFSYLLLDGSNATVKFDSTRTIQRTGEVLHKHII